MKTEETSYNIDELEALQEWVEPKKPLPPPPPRKQSLKDKMRILDEEVKRLEASGEDMPEGAVMFKAGNRKERRLITKNTMERLKKAAKNGKKH